jgi:hypothetical protein
MREGPAKTIDVGKLRAGDKFELVLDDLTGPTLGADGINRSFTDQFSIHEAGNEELLAMIVKIDRSPFVIGLGDDTQAIRVMLELLSGGKSLHDSLP